MPFSPVLATVPNLCLCSSQAVFGESTSLVEPALLSSVESRVSEG